MAHPAPTLRFRLLLDAEHALGPGKVDLLEAIAATGSIAAAGRAMGMSYKRAWQLVEELNRSFREPLVEAVKGGVGGGGARLTRTGEAVLARYTCLRAAAEQAAANDVAALRRLVP